MKSPGAKHPSSKLRISFIFTLVTIAAGGASYGYHLYKLAQDLQINKPQPQVERLVKDLRRFHAETSRFPANFIQINQSLWHTKPTPDYGNDGRRATTKNYYYIYTKVNDETCVFWALPFGPKREYASAFFVVVSPIWLRVWKGKAHSDVRIADLPPIPALDALSQLGFQELLDIKVQ
jgi:hypothetical protein